MRKLDEDKSLTVFRGKLKKLSEKNVFVPADYFFVDASRSQRGKELQQGLAAALALMGDSISATSALQRSNAEMPAKVFEFTVNENRFVGLLDSLPFNDGDEVSVVAARQEGDNPCVPFAVARPADRFIALRPFCVRGRDALWIRVLKRTLILSTLVACVTFWLTIGNLPLLESTLWSVLAWGCGAVVLLFIEWRLYVENHQPSVHLTERVLALLGVGHPESADLVKIAKKTKTGNEPPGYRWNFYRY